MLSQLSSVAGDLSLVPHLTSSRGGSGLALRNVAARLIATGSGVPPLASMGNMRGLHNPLFAWTRRLGSGSSHGQLQEGLLSVVMGLEELHSLWTGEHAGEGEADDEEYEAQVWTDPGMRANVRLSDVYEMATRGNVTERGVCRAAREEETRLQPLSQLLHAVGPAPENPMLRT